MLQDNNNNFTLRIFTRHDKPRQAAKKYDDE